MSYCLSAKFSQNPEEVIGYSKAPIFSPSRTDIEPVKELLVAKMSPLEAFVECPPTKRASRYEIKTCLLEKCTTRQQDSCDFHLISQESGSLYDIEITVHQENFTSEYYNGSLQMMTQGTIAVGSR